MKNDMENKIVQITNNNILEGFAPINSENCRILILGTMPGAESLRKQQYYAYRMNQFWRIIFEIFNLEMTEDYEMKKKVLLEHNIALWDVLKYCERKDSSDSNIKAPVANDFNTLFQKLPKLEFICFNGKEAEKLYKKMVIGKYPTEMSTRYAYIVFPSTSPANTKKYEQKLYMWRSLVEL
jgi:hypoxanthine-DNA glycosylase